VEAIHQVRHLGRCRTAVTLAPAPHHRDRPPLTFEVYSCSESGEVPRGEKMLYSGTDPASYITKYTSIRRLGFSGKAGVTAATLAPASRNRDRQPLTNRLPLVNNLPTPCSLGPVGCQ